MSTDKHYVVISWYYDAQHEYRQRQRRKRSPRSLCKLTTTHNPSKHSSANEHLSLRLMHSSDQPITNLSSSPSVDWQLKPTNHKQPSSWQETCCCCAHTPVSHTRRAQTNWKRGELIREEDECKVCRWSIEHKHDDMIFLCVCVCWPATYKCIFSLCEGKCFTFSSCVCERERQIERVRERSWSYFSLMWIWGVFCGFICSKSFFLVFDWFFLIQFDQKPKRIN